MKSESQQILLSTPIDLNVNIPAEGWSLESGKSLPVLNIRYETWGSLNADKSNAILICTPLTADAHAAGKHHPDDPKPGWWDPMIGPGKALDTNRYFIICSNILGGCQGTTGPSSLNPLTGRPFGSDFPNISIGDMVNAQKEVIDHLGIDCLYGVVGGSMGGFQVIKWGIMFPDRVKKCAVLAATTKLSAQALGFEIIGRGVITGDPQFNQGDYYNKDRRPDQGLSNARKIAHLTYLSSISMEQKFGRRGSGPSDPSHFVTGFDVETYLEHQGQKFVDRFDANSYLHITWAMDNFDLEHEYGSLYEAVRHTQAEFLVVNLSSDWLFPPKESREFSQALLNTKKKVSNVELNSPYGHDAFLLEVEHLSVVLDRFFKNEDQVALTADQKGIAVFKEREDLRLLENLIPAGSRVLDIGCGDGGLIGHLRLVHGSDGVGVDLDFQSVLGCLAKGVPILQMDLDDGLSLVETRSFDLVVLNKTLQQIQRPDKLLREILRVAPRGIISFPNFGHWSIPLTLFFKGRMPVSADLPDEWYHTKNIHLFTYKDFRELCARRDIEIKQTHTITKGWFNKLLCKLGLLNIGAQQITAEIATKPEGHTERLVQRYLKLRDRVISANNH
jgi:homoserine O-acetyltransferase